jgi:hypothetical protein
LVIDTEKENGMMIRNMNIEEEKAEEGHEKTVLR